MTDDMAGADSDTGSDFWDGIADFLADLGFDIPDWSTAQETAAGAADASRVGQTSGLANDGFYASLPSMDSTTAAVLDQTAQLIKDTNEWAEDTFGEEEWAQTLVTAAATDPYGLAAGIESPAEMQARFMSEDAAAEQRFNDWRYEQDQIADAEAAVTEAQRLADESDDLLWDTSMMLKYG
jgi:hypothetical protein